MRETFSCHLILMLCLNSFMVSNHDQENKTYHVHQIHEHQILSVLSSERISTVCRASVLRSLLADRFLPIREQRPALPRKRQKMIDRHVNYNPSQHQQRAS